MVLHILLWIVSVFVVYYVAAMYVHSLVEKASKRKPKYNLIYDIDSENIWKEFEEHIKSCGIFHQDELDKISNGFDEQLSIDIVCEFIYFISGKTNKLSTEQFYVMFKDKTEGQHVFFLHP